jgi:hypothetical protein
MTGPLGVWQHANGTEPDPAFGTCTDDVARALTVDLLQRRMLGWEAVSATAGRSMAYLSAAFDPALGTFHDFRGADGAWLDGAGSQDCQGRALLSLGIAARDAPEVGLRRDARSLFDAALPAARVLTAPRAVASVILGCDAALDGQPDEGTRATLGLLAHRLRSPFWDIDPESDWLWPESELTYENALLPHALIVAGRRLADPDLRRVGLEVLDWLIAIQTTRRGTFTPVGNDGWWPHGGVRSRFAQQPIEATALILAAGAAYEVASDVAYRRAAESAYAWFLGDNEGDMVIADVATGGCHDGLEEAGVNQNQGAESTLMWLTAVETIRAMRTRASAVRTQAPGRGATLVEVR